MQLSGRISPNHKAIGSILHIIDDRQTDRDMRREGGMSKPVS